MVRRSTDSLRWKINGGVWILGRKKLKKAHYFLLFISTVVLVICVIGCVKGEREDAKKTSLWPEIEPYGTDYLEVSDIHEIYYELLGNPSGKPAFFLHGGPGGGTSPRARRFFNPEKFHIVLHDQRGAGKSRPKAEIRENTTQDLISDIERLRKHLDLDKILLVGGSWGSTLALAYAETFPENVSGIILRGVFTASKGEIDHFYHGGTSLFFPDVYDQFINTLPDPKRTPIPPYLLELLQEEDPEIRKKYTAAWARYEGMLAFLEAPKPLIEDWIEQDDPYDFALLENHYMANNCFLEERQLLDNTDKIIDIPVTIVQGRYDAICPPITAYLLHQKLPKSKLVLVEKAGHVDSVDPLMSNLIEAIKEFE
jgi:proline iminopeptidase